MMRGFWRSARSNSARSRGCSRKSSGTVYHSILREIGFKKNLSSRVVRTECARRNGWAGPGFGKS